jgi:hypothetical protein
MTAELDRTCSMCRTTRNVYRTAVEKNEGNRLLGRKEDNIKMHHREIGCKDVNRAELHRVRANVRLCDHGHEHSGSTRKKE